MLMRSCVVCVIRFAVLTQYRRVTDRRTDGWIDGQAHDGG